MPNDAAAEKAGSAENGYDAIVHGRHGLDSSAHVGCLDPAGQVTWTACLLSTVDDVGYLIQMRVDLVR